jgi:hypothetical protein
MATRRAASAVGLRHANFGVHVRFGWKAVIPKDGITMPTGPRLSYWLPREACRSMRRSKA